MNKDGVLNSLLEEMRAQDELLLNKNSEVKNEKHQIKRSKFD